ncbi:MAG: hypothetical protein ACU85E_04795 [Gammaproteobacteria bacterium]
MIRYLAIIIFSIVYPPATQAAKVGYHVSYELQPIEAAEISRQNLPEFPNQPQEHILSSRSDPVEDSLFPLSRFNGANNNQESGKVSGDRQQLATEKILTETYMVESVNLNVGTTGQGYIDTTHFSQLTSGTQEFLSLYIDETINLDSIIQETVNQAQQFNETWNELDDQLTREIYQRLGYLGFTGENFNRDNYFQKRVSWGKQDKHFDLEVISVPENYVEPEGFSGFILNLPRLFTFNNLILALGILLLGNGLLRLMRFILLRI